MIPALRLVVALLPEAKAWIEAYRLHPATGPHPFQVFRNDRSCEVNDVALVVSGIGKVASAAATAYLFAVCGGERHAVWLNVGIAGHGSRGVGELILGHKIRDQATGRCFFPPLVFDPPCPSDEILTVDRVEHDYAEPVVYEMEASGFYATASRLATAELVQVAKVVSDGPAAPLAAEPQSAAFITRLLTDVVEGLDGVIVPCLELAVEMRATEADPPGYEAMLARWHFTVSERHQLRRLLGRWRALAPDHPLPEEDLLPLRRGKEVNRRLEAWIDDLPAALL